MTDPGIFAFALADRGPFGAFAVCIDVDNDADFGRILYTNRRFARLLGRSRKEVAGLRVWELMTERDGGITQDVMRAQVAKQEWPASMVAPFCHRRDGRIFLRLHLAPDELMAGATTPSQHLLAFTEPTYLGQRDYDATQAAEHQLDRVNVSLRAANKRLEGMLNTLGEDLRQYLGSISGLGRTLVSRLAKATIDTGTSNQPTIVTTLKHLLNTADAASRLLSDLLDHKALQTGLRRMAPLLLDLEDCLDDAVAKVRERFAQKDVTLEVRTPSDTVTFQADPQGFAQVMLNLLTNACKFTPRGGTVVLEGLPEKHGVVLRVSDNGPGIEASRVPRLFDLTTPTTSPGTEGELGTGFGIAIVHDILAAHGGALLVETLPGRGSTFIARWPQPPLIGEPLP